MSLTQRIVSAMLMGLFVGAVILSLAYRLLVEWLNETEKEAITPGPEAAQETS